MLKQFRHLYPQGSILSELIDIDRGLYIVKVSVQNQNTILGTGLAAAETVEKAEDKARERALMTISLTNPEITPISSAITQIEPTTSSTVETQEITQPVEKIHNDNSSKVQSSTREQAVAEPFNQPESEDFIALETEEITVETNSAIEPQINLFDQPIIPTSTEETAVVETETIETETTVELDFNEIRHKIDLEMKRLNWTKEQGRDFLVNTYGKRSRLHLTDEELLEFWHYLETLPN
jgi:hypothetical protein